MIYNKTSILILFSIFCILAVNATENIRYKPLDFENPGNRRLLKSETGNFFFYRSLPERSMTLGVNGMESLQIRSVSTVQMRKPQVIVIIDNQRKTYDLKAIGTADNLYLYEAINIDLAGKLSSIEILCYDRELFFRAFERIVPKPRPQRLPNLQIMEHGGIMFLIQNSRSSEYYSFEPEQYFSFNINNKRKAVLFVRARLTDRSTPVFDLYRNNQLVERIELSMARTRKYSVAGITHLTVGRRIELPKLDINAQYSLRPVSDHLFIARPVILKE